jgi:hypothetical protein
MPDYIRIVSLTSQTGQFAKPEGFSTWPERKPIPAHLVEFELSVWSKTSQKSLDRGRN